MAESRKKDDNALMPFRNFVEVYDSSFGTSLKSEQYNVIISGFLGERGSERKEVKTQRKSHDKMGVGNHGLLQKKETER